MNNDDINSVVSAGSVLDGYKETEVVENICSRFKVEKKVAVRLIANRGVLKKNLSSAEALKYKSLFQKLGLKVYIVPAVKAHEQPGRPAVNTPTEHKKQQQLLTRSSFEELLPDAIPAVKVTLKYKLGMLLVILLSATAPLLYMGVITGLVAGIVGYSLHVPEVVANTKTLIAKAAFVVIPLLVMSILLLFIIKPLFARHSNAREFCLRKKDHPALFNLVQVMCNRIGVPAPVDIAVNNEVNASAGSASGLAGLYRGKLKLTLGLPLLACMNTREFAGVLAHEFGHFAQKSAMTAYYLVNTINYWFASRAYEPDAWDDRLDRWAKKADWNIVAMAAVMAAKLGIYLTRQMFKALYHFNYNITAFMSRHMEHDADVYESIISGSQQFRLTSIKLRKISYAEHDVYKINLTAWNENKLLKNIPLAISHIEKSYGDEVLEYIENDMRSSETKAWDSHPADHERVDHVLKRNDAGMLVNESPAYELCKNFNKLCEQVTLHSYRRAGVSSPENIVCDNENIMAMREKKEKSSSALTMFFNDDFSGRFIYLRPSKNRSNLPLSLDQTIKSIRDILPEYNRFNDMSHNLASQYINMVTGLAYLESSVDIDFESFNLPSASPDLARQAVNQHRQKIQDTNKKLNELDSLFFHRIQLSARLMPENQLSELKVNLNQLRMFESLQESVIQLDNHLTVMESLMDNEQSLIDAMTKTIHRYGAYCIDESSKIINQSKKIIYGKDGLDTLYDFITTWCEHIYDEYDPYNPRGVIDYAEKLKNAIFYQYYWLLADVCHLSLSVENENGVEPLKLV